MPSLNESAANASQPSVFSASIFRAEITGAVISISMMVSDPGTANKSSPPTLKLLAK